MNPFAPETIIFFIALAAGLLMMLVNAVGGMSHGADADHDVDHDVDGHDQDHDTDHDEGLFGRALSAMGIGRAPLLLVLMIFLTIFGVAGIFLHLMLADRIPLAAVAAHVGALFISVIATRSIAKRVAEWMPRTESYNVSKEDLVGCQGVAVYGISKSSGSAQIRDRTGDIYKVQARSSGDEVIPMNASIIVISYSDADQIYVVTAASN